MKRWRSGDAAGRMKKWRRGNGSRRRTNEEMAARVDAIYRAAEGMKIEGRKREFVQIDGAPQKEERQSSKEMCSRAGICEMFSLLMN